MGMMGFRGPFRLDADDLFRERERIIVEDRLRLPGREARRKLPLLKMSLDPLQSHDKIVISTFVPINSPRLVASSLTSRFWAELR